MNSPLLLSIECFMRVYMLCIMEGVKQRGFHVSLSKKIVLTQDFELIWVNDG